MQPIQKPNQVNWLDELKQLTKTVKPVLKQEPACGILISSLAQRIELIYMYLEHIVIQEAKFFPILEKRVYGALNSSYNV